MVFLAKKNKLKVWKGSCSSITWSFRCITLISKNQFLAQQVGLGKRARYSGEIFKRVGAEVEIDGESLYSTFLSWRISVHVQMPRLFTFYNHYDTVPAGGDQVWTEDPLHSLWCDGIMTDAGLMMTRHITARLSALRKYARSRWSSSQYQFNMEGAEESCLYDLDKYLENMRTNCGADLAGLGTSETKNAFGTVRNLWWEQGDCNLWCQGQEAKPMWISTL